MQSLVYIGALLTLGGIALLLWCIAQVIKARKAQLSDEELRTRIQKVLPLNLAALGLSALGLGCVIAGVLLG